jgi:tyrosyl-tRNA synthetase
VNKTRPVLTPEQIRENAKTYIAQAGKVLDVSPEKLEFRYNSEWLDTLNLGDLLKLAAQMTVARMMERDTFDLRYKAGVAIGVHEFFYPLMQGYDSVCIEADVELGGTDQTFNNLVGRDLQENAGQPRQIVLLMPILVGLDGEIKMSKSKGNYIGLTDEPNDMFGKVMSIPDALMDNYFTLLTDLPRERIAELVDPNKTHPRQAKALLGKMIVAAYYSESAGEEASAEFDRIFAQKQIPTDMPEIPVRTREMNLVDLILTADFAKSKSEARRLIGQNAVSLDEEKLTDADAVVSLSDGAVLRVGKRRFGKIVLT